MSKDLRDSEEEGGDAFIDQNEVGEVVEEVEGEDHPMSDDDEPLEEDHFDENGNLEIDLTNNSSSYFDQHEDSIFMIASHPTLPMVVTGGGDEMGYLWTTHSNPPRVASKLSGHTESLVAGGFTSDGKYLVTGDMNGQIRVWRSKAGGEKWEFFSSLQEVDEVICLRIHPKLPVFAISAKDGSIWVYEMGGNKLNNIAVLSAHSAPVNDILFADVDNEEKMTLISASDDAGIVCWNVYQSTANYHLGPSQLKGEHPWVVLCLSPSGRTFAVGSQDGTMAIVKIDDGAVLKMIDTGNDTEDEESRSVEAIAWSDKTNIVAVGNVEGQIQLWDVASWKVRNTLQIEGAITKLEFIKGTTKLVSSGYDGSLIVWDVISGNKVWQCFGHNAGVLGFAVQENGRRIISAGDEGVSLVFEVGEVN